MCLSLFVSWGIICHESSSNRNYRINFITIHRQRENLSRDWAKPPQFRRKRNRHHTLWFSVPRLISVRTWKTSKMERRARDQLLFPFHVSSICGYRVCIAVLDFFSIVHACEETSSTSDFPMWSLAATLRWSCWRRRGRFRIKRVISRWR